MVARRLLGLTPREFGAHTPREVEELIEGARWRRARWYDDHAWVVAHLMNATGNFKEAVDVQRLLGREPLVDDPRHAPPAEPPMSDKAKRALEMIRASNMRRALKQRERQGGSA